MRHSVETTVSRRAAAIVARALHSRSHDMRRRFGVPCLPFRHFLRVLIPYRGGETTEEDQPTKYVKSRRSRIDAVFRGHFGLAPSGSRNGIPLDGLPLKYQDAISYTKRLGVGYIWIDFSCNIRDSKEDWLKEADRMSDVYSSSYCNIAATAPGDGGFRDRTPANRAKFSALR